MAETRKDMLSDPPTAGWGPNGPWAKRTYYLIGLGGETRDRALRGVTGPDIPAYGSSFGEPQPLLLVNNIETAIHKDHTDLVQVNVEWGLPQPLDVTQQPNLDPVPGIEIGGTLQSVQTLHDVDGNLILVHYADQASQSTIAQPVMVEYQQPLIMLRFQRREPGEAAEMPIGDKAEMFLGATNSKPIWGASKRQWLCTELVGRSADNGLTYDVNYAFQRAAGDLTWDPVGVYQNPDGTTPDDISPIVINPQTGELQAPSNGLVLVRLFRGRKFQQLSL